MITLTSTSHPPNYVNRLGTAAVGAIEGNEPTFTAVVTVEVKVALVNNAEGGIRLGFSELAILQQRKQLLSVRDMSEISRGSGRGWRF